MSKTVSGVLAGVARASTAWMKPYRRAITLALLRERLGETATVTTPAGTLLFHSPTARSLHDTLKFDVGEPDTIRWIDSLPTGSVLWDVGANVGVFSLYAALRGHRVLAFEPAAATYATLVRNIEINGLEGRVAAYCLALSDGPPALDALHMADTGAGHSRHSLDPDDVPTGAAGRVFPQPAMTCAADDFVRLFGAPPPGHVKLDVDGIEDRVLAGAAGTLAGARTLLVEINEDAPPGQSAVHRLLGGLGFVEDAALSDPASRNTIFARRSGRRRL